VLELLTHLVDKSLVVTGERYGRSCYHLLEPIRQHTWEHLVAGDDVGDVRHRHAAFFLEFAEALEREANVGGAGRHAAVEALEGEYPNLQLALRAALDTCDTDLGLRLARTLQFVWKFRLPFGEGYLWTQELLRLPGAGAPTPARAVALLTAARLAAGLGDQEATASYYKEATPRPVNLAIPGSCLLPSSIRGSTRRTWAISVERGCWKEGLLLTRSSGDQASEAILLINLGGLAVYDGAPADGWMLCEEARRLAVDIGHEWVILYSMPRLVETLAHLCARVGHPDVALRRAAPASPYRGHRFPPDVISHAAWLYFRSTSAFVTCRIGSPSVALSSATRPSASGVRSLVRRMPRNCDGAEPGPATSGIWMRCCWTRRRCSSSTSPTRAVGWTSWPPSTSTRWRCYHHAGRLASGTLGAAWPSVSVSPTGAAGYCCTRLSSPRAP
jgi:hypothetical protein